MRYSLSMATTKTTKKPAAKPAAKAKVGRMSLDELMRALEKAGTAQARKTSSILL
jgi:hypothetical protein